MKNKKIKMELKEQIKQELLNQKEEQIKKNIEENSKLKEIILYTKPNNPPCENYKKFFKEQGIKFIEKDITLYNEVISTVQINTVPIIYVNENYLVQGRDFKNTQQCVNILKHFANPEYINPPFEIKLIESIKNLQFNIGQSFQNLSKQLQPIIKVMNEVAKETNE